MVYADRNQISQVLYNLVSNAIKYGREGGFVKGIIKNNETNIILTIQDDGIGIEKQNIPRLFERFYRVDKGRSREEGGTGLGLAIVKHILEVHEEQISVESTKNTGTKFSFSIKKTIINE